jgi:hypothetical protein
MRRTAACPGTFDRGKSGPVDVVEHTWVSVVCYFTISCRVQFESIYFTPITENKVAKALNNILSECPYAATCVFLRHNLWCAVV